MDQQYSPIGTDDSESVEQQNDKEEEDVEEEDFHMKTFLEMTDGLEKIKRIGLVTSQDWTNGGDTIAGSVNTTTARFERPRIAKSDSTLRVITHASVLYYGDRLALSTETVELTMSLSDHDMFCRVVKCFTDMLMGKHTREDLQTLRHDHDELLKRWDVCSGGDNGATDNSSRRAIGDEIHRMIKNMLETPVYYTSSCMALIACGVMLRDLFRNTVGREVADFDELLCFIRERIRHNPSYPFACDCPPANRCSSSYKTLLSLILEVPPIVHNQTYILQILAYLMYNKEGREEIIVLNMKNIVSPGLLDKVPARLAMLIGSLDEQVIKTTMKRLRREIPLSTMLCGGGGVGGSVGSNHRSNTYGRAALENIITAVHDPRVVHLINALPGVENATVELVLERCKNKRVCVNADHSGDVCVPKDNNYGKNRCCGYLRLDPTGMLVSSISLAQLCIYLYTDTRQASVHSQRHFFVRDILLTMAKCSMNMDETCLEEIFGYLDRCDVFKGFAQNPLFTSTFYKLFQTYLKSMKKVADSYKTKRRKRDRLVEKLSGCPL